MSFRESLSLPAVLREVVEPCLARLVRPGELDAVQLDWRIIQLPDIPEDWPRQPGLTIYPGPPRMRDELRLVLTLTFGDESFRFDIATEDYYPSARNGDLADVQDALYSSLQDFIAESRFGWGQLRE